MIIGLDIGYGMTKVIDSSGRVNAFRSIVGIGTPRRLDLQAGEKKTVRTVTIDGNTYTVGDDVLRYNLPILSVRQRNSIESTAYRALILAAVKNSLFADTKIVTGLPVQFIDDAAVLKRVFSETVPGSELVIIPQPAGSFFDLILTSQGEIDPSRSGYTRMRLGVVDIGTYTTDLLLLDSMEAVENLSGSLTVGIHTLASLIIEECSTIRRALSLPEAEEAIMTGKIKKHGKDIDISQTVERIKAQIARDIHSYIRSIWGSDERIDGILLTGGGAFLFKEHFNEQDMPCVTVSENTFMSNVFGYFKLGRRLYGY